eukprot:scpid3014/ scgid19501/ Serine/threonine-protein kinase mTOR; FK506-binding protein 12-rapamycin complex-associated protein 1; FKBP12-rapamycin complex-associated protein; Mammalian target of rapamycin; Mechanistic target of rapamycin; Rapamycin and FKBP12 target 1; Rapamycin target protein 1
MSRDGVVAQYGVGLKSRQNDTRVRNALLLQQFVNNDLRAMSNDEASELLDELSRKYIFPLCSSSDIHEKKGGVLAMMALTSTGDANQVKMGRFMTYLRQMLPTSDVVLTEMVARTIGRLALTGGSTTAGYVDFDMNRAMEWLVGDRHEHKRYAAVLILRELAHNVPTFFFQKVQQFFDCIFNAVRDSKKNIREGAVTALHAGLVLTAQRETKERHRGTGDYYQCAYTEVLKGLQDSSLKSASKEKGAQLTREDLIHGSLLILMELVRCSTSSRDEVIEQQLMNEALGTEGAQPVTPPAPSWEELLRPTANSCVASSIIPRMRVDTSAAGLHAPVTYAGGGRKARSLEQVEEAAEQLMPSTDRATPRYSSVCRALMESKFTETCQLVLNHRNSRSVAVQQIIYRLLPRLALLKPDIFVEKFLPMTMTFLLAGLKKERDKAQAFRAIGMMAYAVGTKINTYLDPIVQAIKQSLPTKESGTAASRRARPTDPAVFSCISLLSRAIGDALYADMKVSLENMLAGSLTPPLTACLQTMANKIPNLCKDIQEGVLKVLSRVLMNQPLRHPGDPRAITSVSTPLPPVEPDTGTIMLAVKTLGEFDFTALLYPGSGHPLTAFVQHCANSYLNHENAAVRKEAVRTCANLLVPIRPIQYPGASFHSMQVSVTSTQHICDVLKKLLNVGVTDPEADVRRCVFANLHERFDTYLAQAENLRALFAALNETEFEVRELAIQITGRLCTINPAFIMPVLRKCLINVLTELQYSGIARSKEQAARLICHLITYAPKLTKPYMGPVMLTLMPLLKSAETSSSLVMQLLVAVGQQAQVCGPDMLGHVPELCPLIIDMLQDSASTSKREVALWTLGQLLSSTGQIEQAYFKHRNLLEVLLNILKMEHLPSIRREAMRVLGLLGALDPYKYKTLTDETDSKSELGSSQELTTTEQADTPSELLINSANGQLEDFYPVTSLTMLMKVLKEPSLHEHHKMCVQAVTLIFQSLGLKCVPFIKQIVPSYIDVIYISDNKDREFLFQQLGKIISVVKQHIRPYLDDIFRAVKTYWVVSTSTAALQNTCVSLLEQIAAALGGEFSIYLPQLMPLFLQVLHNDQSTNRIVTRNLLQSLKKLGMCLDDYLHLLVPPIVKTYQIKTMPIEVRKTAISTLNSLTESVNFSELSSCIVHSLVRVLDTAELQDISMTMICAMIVLLQKDFLIYDRLVSKMVSKYKISHECYERLIGRIRNHENINDAETIEFYKNCRLKARIPSMDDLSAMEAASISRKLTTHWSHLEKDWDSSGLVSREDWMLWLRRLSIKLLKESPSPSLRYCYVLADSHDPIARELFNAAFVSCWGALQENQQEELVTALEQVLQSQSLPEVTQLLLNLAEFMEHTEKGALPLKKELMGECAMKCRAYAKALHYKEEEFHSGPTAATLEALISINNELGLAEAAQGVLVYADKHHEADLRAKETWYEKLRDWDNAHALYEKRHLEDPDNLELTLGRMRCLEAMGEWSRLFSLAEDKWPTIGEDAQQKMARMAASASWGIANWQSMDAYACMIPPDSYDGAFYRSVIAIHDNQFDLAQRCIDLSREILDTELTAMVGESYNRAYQGMVFVQMLSELEEVVLYKTRPEKQPVIRKIWWDRLQNCDRNVEDWQRILRVRSLVLTDQENKHTLIKFASLCRKSNRLELSHKTLCSLFGCEPSKLPEVPTTFPHVAFAYMKHLWDANDREKAYQHLIHFVRSSLHPQAMSMPPNMVDMSMHMSPGGHYDTQGNYNLNRLLAKCYLKLGEWQIGLRGLSEKTIPQIINFYNKATEHDSSSYKAWHHWAMMNFEAVLYYGHRANTPMATTPVSPTVSYQPLPNQSNARAVAAVLVHQYAKPAVQGFFRSIALAQEKKVNSLQDTLRLLTLWFEYGHWPDVYESLMEGVKSIQVDTWLQVIPQLIARIHTHRQLVGRLIHHLLIDIGKHHPQALIYPLTVASKSTSQDRRNAANLVLQNMREHSNTLVNQAIMVSDELIRVAILWHEQWHEGLEEASRLYFGERNVQSMFQVLEPLHEMMARGAQTVKETNFNQAYGRDLQEANEWCKKYRRSNNDKDLTQAWDLYYHIFRRISKQLPTLTNLELQSVSPKLMACHDLELSVPGLYEVNKPIIRIQKIAQALNVITSKQRPRKLSIYGSNGSEFMFLLKGHEDLRQDERVMQLFGLVNTLLANDSETFKNHLSIMRYAVIPLSTNSGLIGWVPHCDTLHALIRDYREKKKILLNIEHRIMLRMAPEYDHLTVTQKVEVFEHAIEHTSGDDLARVLWLKSPSSEVWFDRRTNYSRSLAVMSMVGYVLGLGDRHPSNLMLERLSGRILHIDFGDCFEVAMTRDKFPEKIPFRLTRMLTNAMEVTGIEGNFRLTCHSTMRVLRAHKDSVMAVLEAFVYDPLLNWRLTNDGQRKSKPKTPAANGAHGAVGGPAVPMPVPVATAGPEHNGGAAMLEPNYGLGIGVRPVHGAVYGPDDGAKPEAMDKRALQILGRVRDKLTGHDFPHVEQCAVETQVKLLVEQAASHQNLCQCYIGWCPFW